MITHSPAKTRRAEQIEECIRIVAAHYNLDPLAVLQSAKRPSQTMTDARTILWYHLRSCGLSYVAIGVLWKISDTVIGKCARQGMVRLGASAMELAASLPKIGNTLEISRAEEGK